MTKYKVNFRGFVYVAANSKKEALNESKQYTFKNGEILSEEVNYTSATPIGEIYTISNENEVLAK